MGRRHTGDVTDRGVVDTQLVAVKAYQTGKLLVVSAA
jgi:hypothetical protein